MRYIIYHIVIIFLRVSAWIVSPFHPKAKSMIKGKKKWKIESSSKPTFWMHCASLGEFEQGRPVLEAFKKAYPDWRIVLTFFSPTGIEHTKNYRIADKITYLPWDSKKNAKEFYNIVQPKLVCFVKYEFWFHILLEGNKRGIPLLLISGIFRKDQAFFKWYGSFHQRFLKNFTTILVQNEQSKLLLDKIDVSSEVCGDSRIDRVLDIVSKGEPISLLSNISRKVFILGSSWADDLKVVLPVVKNQKDIFTIIAPHEIDRAGLKSLKNSIQGKVEFYTELKDKVDPDSDFLIIDTVGVLSSLYRVCDVAFIGGAYGDGLHNILEPAVFGVPILFGDKKFDKFQEALDLIGRGGACAISNSEELQTQLTLLMTDPAERERRSKIVESYILENKGATKKIMDKIGKLL